MSIYHVTFGQQYPREAHPKFSEAHRDGWVDIVVPDDEPEPYLRAQHITVEHLGRHWSDIYPDDEMWSEMRAVYFPLGCLATFPV